MRQIRRIATFPSIVPYLASLNKAVKLTWQRDALKSRKTSAKLLHCALEYVIASPGILEQLIVDERLPHARLPRFKYCTPVNEESRVWKRGEQRGLAPVCCRQNNKVGH